VTPVEVHFEAASEARLRKLARIRRDVVVSIEAAIISAERMGWEDSLKVERIKVLGPASEEIAELRDLRSGYRLVGFWHDVGGTRQLHITGIAPKGLLTRARLNLLRQTARTRRSLWLAERRRQQ
jgi:hypothetical protein